MKYVCELCGFIYDEEKGLADSGIAAGTAWADVSADFECPGCYCGKEAFDKRPERPQRIGSAEPVLACTDVKQVSEK